MKSVIKIAVSYGNIHAWLKKKMKLHISVRAKPNVISYVTKEPNGNVMEVLEIHTVFHELD